MTGEKENLRDGALGAGGAEVLGVGLADEETVLLVSGNAVARVCDVGDGAGSIADGQSISEDRLY